MHAVDGHGRRELRSLSQRRRRRAARRVADDGEDEGGVRRHLEELRHVLGDDARDDGVPREVERRRVVRAAEDDVEGHGERCERIRIADLNRERQAHAGRRHEAGAGRAVVDVGVNLEVFAGDAVEDRDLDVVAGKARGGGAQRHGRSFVVQGEGVVLQGAAVVGAVVVGPRVDAVVFFDVVVRLRRVHLGEGEADLDEVLRAEDGLAAGRRGRAEGVVGGEGWRRDQQLLTAEGVPDGGGATIVRHLPGVAAAVERRQRRPLSPGADAHRGQAERGEVSEDAALPEVGREVDLLHAVGPAVEELVDEVDAADGGIGVQVGEVGRAREAGRIIEVVELRRLDAARGPVRRVRVQARLDSVGVAPCLEARLLGNLDGHRRREHRHVRHARPRHDLARVAAALAPHDESLARDEPDVVVPADHERLQLAAGRVDEDDVDVSVDELHRHRRRDARRDERTRVGAVERRRPQIERVVLVAAERDRHVAPAEHVDREEPALVDVGGLGLAVPEGELDLRGHHRTAPLVVRLVRALRRHRRPRHVPPSEVRLVAPRRGGGSLAEHHVAPHRVRRRVHELHRVLVEVAHGDILEGRRERVEQASDALAAERLALAALALVRRHAQMLLLLRPPHRIDHAQLVDRGAERVRLQEELELWIHHAFPVHFQQVVDSEEHVAGGSRGFGLHGNRQHHDPGRGVLHAVLLHQPAVGVDRRDHVLHARRRNAARVAVREAQRSELLAARARAHGNVRDELAGLVRAVTLEASEDTEACLVEGGVQPLEFDAVADRVGRDDVGGRAVKPVPKSKQTACDSPVLVMTRK
mmetsp:Transcript_7051/g.23132  ORF Transcript_7051/g.23132 Transcript_7051/m.23132 type:complete len:814 (-) Transcript_7051:2150-4591(-)